MLVNQPTKHWRIRQCPRPLAQRRNGAYVASPSSDPRTTASARVMVLSMTLIDLRQGLELLLVLKFIVDGNHREVEGEAGSCGWSGSETWGALHGACRTPLRSRLCSQLRWHWPSGSDMSGVKLRCLVSFHPGGLMPSKSFSVKNQQGQKDISHVFLSILHWTSTSNAGSLGFYDNFERHL